MNSSQKPSKPKRLGIGIEIEATALAKLWAWVDMAGGEVSCLGYVEEIVDEKTGKIESLLVTDFFLVKQSCTSQETTMDPSGLAELLAELEANGLDSGKLLCWAHSHADMEVFWSGTDNQCIADLANGRYLLSLVVNKKRDSKMRLDQYHPAHLTVDDLQWDVYVPLDESTREFCEAEFKEKVTEQGSASITSHQMFNKEYLDMLKSEHDSGKISTEELEEEVAWMSFEAGV